MNKRSFVKIGGLFTILSAQCFCETSLTLPFGASRVIYAWLGLAGTVLLVPAMWGIYQYLIKERNSNSLQLGVILMLTGVPFLLGIYLLAYVSAVSTDTASCGGGIRECNRCYKAPSRDVRRSLARLKLLYGPDRQFPDLQRCSFFHLLRQLKNTMGTQMAGLDRQHRRSHQLSVAWMGMGDPTGTNFVPHARRAPEPDLDSRHGCLYAALQGIWRLIQAYKS